MGAARQVGLFTLLWLAVGFVSGSWLLMGPVRRLALVARDRGWSDDVESWIVRGAIAVLVVATALVAAWLAGIVARTATRHVRLGVPGLALACAAATLGLWLSPGLMGSDAGPEQSAGGSFTFGPYPGEAKLASLRERGFTAVVSLLHPAVVPFETKLIADGREAVERAGLEYVHAPMLPWVSDNAESVARLRGLAERGDGRYYVHCYLGKDRIRIARRVIDESLATGGETVFEASTASHAAARRLDDVESLERGPVVRLDDDAWLIPFPTDNEMMSYLLPGTHGRVVSLLDPDDPDDRPWLERERELLEGNGLALTVLPLSNEPFDSEAVLEAARHVATGERPVVVHGFLAPASGRAPTAEGFLQAFRSGLPPLPPALFADPLAGGPARVVAPNVAVGPRPTARELETVLPRRGVRGVVAVGPEIADDRAVAERAGLAWRAVDEPTSVEAVVRDGGPWYVFGALTADAREALADALGPAVPADVRWRPRTTPPPTPVPPPAEAALDEPSRGPIARFVPEVRTVVLSGPLCLLFGALAAAAAGHLRSWHGVRAPYTRKLFHFAIFTGAGLVHLSAGLPAVSLYGAAISLVVLYAVWRGDGFPFYEALARPSDAPRRSLFILVPLATTAAGGVLANLLFGAFASIGYLVCGWGDAVGEPVGTRFGRHRFRVPSLGGVAAWRSLEGSAAVLAVGALAATGGLLLAGQPPAVALGVGLACGLGGAAVEAFSHHGLDNLTVQLAAAGAAWLLLGG